MEHLDGYLYLRFKLARPRDGDDGYDAAAWSWISRLLSIDPKEFYETGIPEQNIEICRLSTYDHPELLHSFRRDGSGCGHHGLIAGFAEPGMPAGVG